MSCDWLHLCVFGPCLSNFTTSTDLFSQAVPSPGMDVINKP